MTVYRLIIAILFCMISREIQATEMLPLKSNWQYSVDGAEWQETATPCLKPSDVKGDRVIFRRQLPELGAISEPVLFMETMSQPFKVISGGKTIYEYLDVQGAKNQFRGYPWHLIDLSGVKGSDIQITVAKNQQVFLGFCKKTYVGNRDAIYRHIMVDDLGIVVVSLVLLLVALLSGVAAYLSQSSKLLMSFATLSAAIGVWIFTTPEVKLRLFLVHDPFFWMAPGHLALFLIPPVFIYYCLQMFQDGLWRAAKLCMAIHLIYIAGVLALMFAGKYDYPRGNYFFNLIVPFSTLLMTLNILWLAYKNHGKARLITVGLFIFVGFAVHDWLIGMWILNWTALCLHWGFLILMAFLGVPALAEVKNLFTAEARYAAVSNVAQMVAHDVKQPFLLLKMTLNRLIESESPQEIKRVAKENVAAVRNSALGINQILSDLTALDGNLQLAKEQVHVDEAIDGILKEYRLLIDKSAIKITRLESFRGTIMADPIKMKRVIANIVQNAIEAQPDGGVISIATTKSGKRHVAIEIGSQSFIEPEKVPKIFNKHVSFGKKSGR